MRDTSKKDTPLAQPPDTGRKAWGWALLVFSLALVVRIPFLPAPGFAADQAQFILWSIQTRDSGPSALYAERPEGSGRRSCNYPPVYINVLSWLRSAYDGLAAEPLTADAAYDVWKGRDTPAARAAVWSYKLPAVLADAVLAALLVVWVRPYAGRTSSLLIGSFYAVHPVAIHNSAIWGQVDAIHTLLMVGSLELARNRRMLWGAALAALAVLTKAQAIVLLPLWFVLQIGWAGKSSRRWGATGLVLSLVALLALIPFLGVLDGVGEAYLGAARYYPYTHLNGFSAWFLGNPLDQPHLEGALSRYYQKDNTPAALGLTPRQWGVVGTLSIWAFVLFRLWRRGADSASVSWAVRVLPLAFFIFSTQMHERYLFPAVALWAWAYQPSRRWWCEWTVLGLVATLNSLWAWTGPASACWSVPLRQVLHREWMGMLPGTWCATTLIVLLGVTLAEGFTGDPPKSSKQTTAA